MNSSVPQPGLRNQSAVRGVLRVLGPLVVLAGIVLVVLGMKDFGPDPMYTDEPDRFWMAGVGLPVIVVGLWLCMAGYASGLARYSAGESMPVLKDSAAYLSDGHGVAGVGRTVDDAPAGTAGTSAGPYCRGCGTRNDAEAKFCDSCGQSLA